MMRHHRLALLLLAPAAAARAAVPAALSAGGRWAYSADRFPSVWFGANSTGPDAPHLAANDIDKYAAVYFGWQAGNGVTGCRHEESWLRNQTAAVKALKPAINTLAYIGNGASLLDFYDAQRAVIQDPALSGFFLSKPKVPSASQGVAGDCPTSTATWDFRNASAVDYFVEHVVGQWSVNC